MSLTADPPNGTVPATGGTLTHNLVNGGAEKLVFKVRSSNNTEYRVKPVFGFVDPGASTKLEITRLAGPPKEDKMVVQFAPAPAGATDPAAAFASVQPAGNVTIPLSATAPAAEAPPAAPAAEAPPAAPAGEAPPAAPPPQ